MPREKRVVVSWNMYGVSERWSLLGIKEGYTVQVFNLECAYSRTTRTIFRFVSFQTLVRNVLVRRRKWVIDL